MPTSQKIKYFLKFNQLALGGLIFGVLFFGGVFLILRNVQAATSTVRGSAWWGDQLQYLYFDCLDDVVGDRLDQEGNLYALPEPRGFHFYATPCTSIVHHVSLDANDNLSGQAWNYSKGLVYFDATTTPPDNYAFNANCPHTCNLSNNCWACYNETDQQVYGWGHAADGTWIKLDSEITATTSPTKIQDWSKSVLPGYNIEPGIFVGYATATTGPGILSPLSFNCLTAGDEDGSCATRGDYKVYIKNLQLHHMSAPNWSYQQACGDTALKVVLRWYIKSGTPTAYRLIFNTSNSTSSPVFDSGKITGSAIQYTCPGPLCAWTPNYGTNYYWWIQLWDEDDAPTPLYQFGTVDDHDGTLDLTTDGGNPDNNIQTFTTYKHEFPTPYFTWDPYDVLVATTTDFTSDSDYYIDGQPAAPQDCSGGTCQYLWTTTDTGALIASSTNATTSIIFYRATNTTVTLRVTENSPEAYTCSLTEPLEVNYGLPIWREVKAQ
jgi:hypothetical protein